jgi:hypothetical protein
MPWLACDLHGAYLPVLFASVVYFARSWLLIPPIPIPIPAPPFGAPPSSIAIFAVTGISPLSRQSINASR